ncbi:MAG: hypothetical protein RLZZ08_817 [Pseudomonadota bacterium]|jgi:hypothetical protein
MINEPKTFASLGPSLLARKGGARPAMRPQLGLFGGHGGQLATVPEDIEDDLGWNDMGEDHVPARTIELKLTPSPTLAPQPDAPVPEPLVHLVADEDEEASQDAAPLAVLTLPEPAVKQQLRAIAEHMERQDRASRDGTRPINRRPAVEQGRRAAFTLRLDAQRHLKLRLACTVNNRSAQMLLTEALDKFLAQIPEIEALAAQVKRS